MNNETERAAFDHWYSNEGQFPKSVERSRDGTYMLIGAQSAWNAWQARASAATQAASEPDAWRYKTHTSKKWLVSDMPPEQASEWNEIVESQPLYAAPVVPPVALPALTDDKILHLWDTFVGTPTANIPLIDADKLQFARAILAASAAPAPEQPPAPKRHALCGKCMTPHICAEDGPGCIAGVDAAAPAAEQMQPEQKDRLTGSTRLEDVSSSQPFIDTFAEQVHLAGNRNEAPCGDKADERDAARYPRLRAASDEPKDKSNA